jgi:DNA-binding response OmpR family regulator
VVDDEEPIREMIREGLSIRGFRVQTAANVEEAVALMQTRPFDAILCDLNLRAKGSGENSGLALYTAVSSASYNGNLRPFFLFMTGEIVAAAVAEKLVQTGARILQKPFRMSDLIATLTTALGKTPSGAAQLSQVN